MINVAIIGTGNISRQHIEGYLAFPGRCKIVRMIDIVEGKAAKKTEDFKLDAAPSISFEDALNDPAVDLVSICTPPFEHARIAIAALNAGKHVIVEKPMAASLEECDAMLEAAKKSGRIFSPIAQNRFRDPVANLKKLLDSGKAGRVVHAQIDSHWWRGHSYYDLWWRGTWQKEGGGCTLNHAVHHIDMLGWMLGLPQSITAVLSNASHDNAEVEDVSIAILQYGASELCAKGALAQITSSVIHHGEEQQVIFQCEKARISAPWKIAASTAQPNGFPVKNEALEKELTADYQALPVLKHTAHAGQIENVLDAIEGKGSLLIQGEDGRKTIELITAIYKAGSEQGPVELPIVRGDPFYTVEGIMRLVPHFYEKTNSVENQEGNITVGSNYQK
ncbi:MAG: Gfo/Idh/MocA family oxidoreductase [Spirochaetales bacterium]|jgi:predicted dehydrogenase|nr:Gfo/Idh/MocA family oxidoreductase [Spirochaetales bacterium]